MVGREGLCEGATRNRLEQRRFYLEESVLVFQPAAHERDHAGSVDQGRPRLLIHHEVDIALPIAGVGIGEPVPLVRELPFRLGEERPRGDLDRQLALLRSHDETGDADPVAEAERGEGVEVGRDVGRREQLYAAGRVLELTEGQLALPATEHQPPGDRDGGARL